MRTYIWGLYFSIWAGSIVTSIGISQPQVGIALPETSVASSDNALASFFNPAGLSHNQTLDLHYLRSSQNQPIKRSNQAFFLATPNSGFSVEGLGGVNGFKRYTVASGFSLGSSFSLGVSYGWSRAKKDTSDRSWSLGALYRRRFLSFGMVARDLNRNSSTPHFLRSNHVGESNDLNFGRSLDLGFAIRPGTSRMTLSCDWQVGKDIFNKSINYQLLNHLLLGLEVRPVDPLILKAGLTPDGYAFQFQINLAQFGFGAYRPISTSTGRATETESVGFLNFTQAFKTKPIRRRFYLDLKAEEIGDLLHSASEDPRIQGALIRFGSSNLGFGEIQELRQKILHFQEQDKKMYAYLEGDCSTGNYLLASACHQILIHSSSTVDLIGLRFEVSFYRQLLDQLGIEVEVLKVGKYKNAPESFTGVQMSDAHRESLTAVLDDLYDQLTQAVAEGRGKSVEEIKTLIDNGPYTAQRAVENKVVDKIVTRHQLEELFQAEKLETGVYYNQLDYDWQLPKPKVAVIEAHGNMMTGESWADPFFGQSIMGADTISAAVKSVTEDPSVKAVVLRIDSGGGSVLAADIIWQKLIQLKEEKTLVVSMADTAASGGYYIAAPADRILANPGTITGSIGVFGMKPVVDGFYQKLGINHQILKRGRNADLWSIHHKSTGAQRQQLTTDVEEIYDDFVWKVANGRNLSVEAVDKVAQGRIWSGRQALENGLVDQLGGEADAILVAHQLAKLDPNETEIERISPKSSFLGGWLRSIANRSDWRENTSTLLHRLRYNYLWSLTPYELRLGK